MTKPQLFQITSGDPGRFLQEVSHRIWELDREVIMAIVRRTVGKDVNELTPEQLMGFGFRIGYGIALTHHLSGCVVSGIGAARRKGYDSSRR